MNKEYFHEALKQFGTEFWVNNPSGIEMQKAYESGAVGVTDNPCYMSVLLKSDRDFANKIIDEAIKKKTLMMKN